MLWNGISRSAVSNSTRWWIDNPTTWMARNAIPALATVAWNAAAVDLATRVVTSDVVDRSPQAVDRNRAK